MYHISFQNASELSVYWVEEPTRVQAQTKLNTKLVFTYAPAAPFTWLEWTHDIDNETEMVITVNESGRITIGDRYIYIFIYIGIDLALYKEHICLFFCFSTNQVTHINIYIYYMSQNVKTNPLCDR